MSNTSTVQVTIVGGPSVAIPWFQGMNAQQALEGAYAQINDNAQFTYATQYYGPDLGYLAMMINETYDSFTSSAAPFYYWEFLLNGSPAQAGIDGVALNAGDVVGFSFEMYDATRHATSTLMYKHLFRLAQAAHEMNRVPLAAHRHRPVLTEPEPSGILKQSHERRPADP